MKVALRLLGAIVLTALSLAAVLGVGWLIAQPATEYVVELAIIAILIAAIVAMFYRLIRTLS